MKVVDIFSDIVVSMRSVNGTIDNIAESGGISTVTSVNTLVERELVTIGYVQYPILTVSASEFTIKATGLTATTWSARDPYYEIGHPLEVSNLLLEKNKNDKLKYQKYPLIVLFTDVKIKSGEKNVVGILENLNISILGLSQANYSSRQRYESNIKTVLYPLYNTLINKIKSSKYFIGTNPNLKHDLIERPFWGSSSKYGNVKNMFTDPLDALEMSNITMKLTSRNINC